MTSSRHSQGLKGFVILLADFSVGACGMQPWLPESVAPSLVLLLLIEPHW